MRIGARRLAVALAVVVLLAAAGAVADPHRGVLDDDTRYVVQPELSPSVIWNHALLNTGQASVTIVAETYPAPGNRSLQRKWVHRYDPDAHRYYGSLFFDGPAGETWGVSEVFVGEAVQGERLGDVPRPSTDAPVAAAVAESWAEYGAFDGGGDVLAADDPDSFRTLRSNETTVVIGAADDEYADLRGFDERQVVDGSYYRVHVDRDTGRIARVVEHRRLRDRDDGEVHETYTIRRFTGYGETDVARPEWVGFHPLELVYDAFTL